MNVEKLLEKAKKTNAERDAIDRKAGAATPLDMGVREVMRVAIAALRAGMRTTSWDCVAEALVMLDQAEKCMVESAVARPLVRV